MKVDLYGNNLIIIPETDFEAEYLQEYFDSENDNVKVYHSRGTSMSDYRGIVLKVENKK